MTDTIRSSLGWVLQHELRPLIEGSWRQTATPALIAEFDRS